METREYVGRNEAIAKIRAALKRRSGKAWSVTGGRGTAWGWIKIDAPPSRCTWGHRPKAGFSPNTAPPGDEGWEEYDTGLAGRGMSPADRAELSALLGTTVHRDGHSIPASADYYIEAIDRAEGRTPRVIGTPYWD